MNVEQPQDSDVRQQPFNLLNHSAGLLYCFSLFLPYPPWKSQARLKLSLIILKLRQKETPPRGLFYLRCVTKNTNLSAILPINSMSIGSSSVTPGRSVSHIFLVPRSSDVLPPPPQLVIFFLISFEDKTTLKDLPTIAVSRSTHWYLNPLPAFLLYKMNTRSSQVTAPCAEFHLF